jgi:vesicle coat complex subunit
MEIVQKFISMLSDDDSNVRRSAYDALATCFKHGEDLVERIFLV